MSSSLKIETLRKFVNAGDRIGYYTQLAAWGDKYAPFALGVVTNETLSGATANIYFLQKNRENERKVNWNQLAEISVQLMNADFNARQNIFPTGNPINLSADNIWDYHKAVFKNSGISSDAWTVDFVFNQIPEFSERQKFWDKLLSSDGITNSLPASIKESTQSFVDYVHIVKSSLSPNVLGSADYIADLTMAGALALTAPSTDYGPYSVEVSGTGVVAGGNWLNDTLTDGEGDDVLIGFDGDDDLIASSGNDRIYGGPDNDLIVGGDGGDRLIGGDGNDMIYAGTVADDRLSGLAKPEDSKKTDLPITFDNSDDFINSGSGNDHVYIGGGKDIVMLGDGDDSVYLEPPNQVRPVTVLWGGDGADKFYIKSFGSFIFLNVPEMSESQLANIDINKLYEMYSFL